MSTTLTNTGATDEHHEWEPECRTEEDIEREREALWATEDDDNYCEGDDFTTPTETADILDVIAAKVLNDHPREGNLRVEAVLTDYSAELAETGKVGDDITCHIHSFKLAGLTVKVAPGTQPFDIIGDLTAGLLARGVKWDTDNREFMHAADTRYNVAYDAEFEGPVARYFGDDEDYGTLEDWRGPGIDRETP